MSHESNSAPPFGRFERSMAWRYVRARRQNGGASLIAVISFVGIALATYALIVVMSVMAGYRAVLVHAVLGSQPHISLDMTGYAADDVERFADEIRTIAGIQKVIPGVEQAVIAANKGATSFAKIRGIAFAELGTLSFLKTPNLLSDLAQLPEGDGPNGVVIGYRLANKLGVSAGDNITLIGSEANVAPQNKLRPRTRTFEIIDVYKTGTVAIDEFGVFMPLPLAESFLKTAGQIPLLDVRLDDPDASQAMAYEILNAAGPYHEIFTNGFDMKVWQERETGALQALQLSKSMMRMVLLILVMVTSMNIVAGVVMIVKNKTEDIAILRTIGLGRGSVLRIFVMIGAFLGLIGALVGAAFGILTVINIAHVEAFFNFVLGVPIFDPETYGLDGLPAKMDWGEAAMVSAFAFVVSGFVAFLPARWASRLDPVKGFKHEFSAKRGIFSRLFRARSGKGKA